jgi:hypothetical protein
MSITVQFLQQQQPVQAAPQGEPAAPCGLRPIARNVKSARRPMRIRASAPQSAPPAEVEAAAISAYVPYAGRSVLHKRIHAGNIAAIGRMLALQQQVLEQGRQTAILQQQTQAQLKIATATEVMSKREPDDSPPGRFDPALNHAKFSLIADVVAVTAHLMDKQAVDAATFLEDKLKQNTAPLIEEVRGLLEAYELEAASGAFERAVDSAIFERFVQSGELASPAVYREINRRAGLLLATMLMIAAADFGGDIDPGDWPSPPDGGGDHDWIGQTPSPAVQSAPTATQAPQAAAAKVATRRARKIAPRSKR